MKGGDTVKIDNTYDVPIAGFASIENAKEIAAKILGALHGAPIDTAISLLEWCSRDLLNQRVDAAQSAQE